MRDGEALHRIGLDVVASTTGSKPRPLQPLHHPLSYCPAMMVGMGFIGHFSLWLVDQRPYWHCGDFGGILFGGGAA